MKAKKIPKTKRKSVHRSLISRKQAVLSVVCVRISDEEKERLDTIMRSHNITRYADVLRQAIKMVKLPQDMA